MSFADHADDLEAALTGVELHLKRIDQILTDVGRDLTNAAEPLSVAPRTAGNQLDDLAEVSNQLRRAKDLLHPPHSDAHDLLERAQDRMYHLAIPAGRPGYAGGFVFTPTVSRRSSKAAPGLDWESPLVHAVLEAYGMGDVVRTAVNHQSALGALNELKKQYGEDEPIPPVTVRIVDADTGEVVDKEVSIEDVVIPSEKFTMRRTKAKK